MMTDPLDDFAMFENYVRDQHPIVQAIDEALQAQNAAEPQRGYMGASIIGQPCTRALWYDYTHASGPKEFPPYILRRFESGHSYEARCVEWLRLAGFDVEDLDEHGEQFRFSHLDGAISGGVDGFIFWDGKWHLLEVKAMVQAKYKRDADGNPIANKQAERASSLQGRWFKTRKEGVKKAQPQHYAQMQLYMLASYFTEWPATRLDSAIYIAIGTDTEHIHVECVPYDEAAAHEALERAVQTVATRAIPERLHESPVAFDCRYCDHKNICHGTDEMARTCRTCRFADPIKWECQRLDIDCPSRACVLWAACEDKVSW